MTMPMTENVATLTPTRRQQVETAKVALLTMEQESEDARNEAASLREQLTLQKLESQSLQAHLITAIEERDIMRGERDEAVAQRIAVETFVQLLAKQLIEFTPPVPMVVLPARRNGTASDAGRDAVARELDRMERQRPVST